MSIDRRRVADISVGAVIGILISIAVLLIFCYMNYDMRWR